MHGPNLQERRQICGTVAWDSSPYACVGPYMPVACAPLICLWHALLYACGMRSYACGMRPCTESERARGPIYRTLSAEQRRVQPGSRSSILAHGFIRLYRSTAPSPTRRCSYLCRPAPRMAVADPGDGYCPQCKTDDVKFEIRDSTFDIRTRICISVGKPRREE